MRDDEFLLSVIASLGGVGEWEKGETWQVWSKPQGGPPLTPFWRGTRVYRATQYFQHTALAGCLLLPTMLLFGKVSLGRKAPWSADCHPEVFQRFLPVSISGLSCKREEKLNKREDTRETMVFREHLNPQQTVSTSVGSG